MAKTYEEYEQEQLKKAQKEQQAYEAARRAQADTAVKQVEAVYAAAKQNAEQDYRKRAEQTAQGYREVFDANAVNELVARRRAAEAIANTNMANSGLNNTQQTAISLQRAAADRDTVLRRQQAVQGIMQVLDEQKRAYDEQAAEKKAEILSAADEDIGDNLYSLTKDARDHAQKAVVTDQQEEEEPSLTEQMYNPEQHGTRFADMTPPPSWTALRADATRILRAEGNNAAWLFLMQRANRGYLTGYQAELIMKDIGIEVPEPANYTDVQNKVWEYIIKGDRQGGMEYVRSLHEQHLITVRDAYKWYDQLGMTPD